MKVTYYPGCTLPEKARGYESTAFAVAERLGIELDTLDDWTCCGAAFPQVTDDIMQLVAPVRNLNAVVQQDRSPTLVTLCVFCYNVLKRANRLVRTEPETLEKLNDFIDEGDYAGQVRVLHYLEVLRDIVGFGEIAPHVQRDISSLKCACYYGCLLLRPAEEMKFDDPENPSVLEDLLEVLGGSAVPFPHRTECCGSYLVVNAPDSITSCVERIAVAARDRGANAIVTACPLCQFNLGKKQEEVAAANESFVPIPVLYFTEVMALAFGIGEERFDYDAHIVNPRPLLESLEPTASGG
jgi:heterodisulfide reductase subunit B